MFELNSSYFISFFKSSWWSNMCRRINKALTSLRMYSVDYIYKTSVVKGANCCIHFRKVWCWSLNINYLPLVCLHIIYLNSTLILPCQKKKGFDFIVKPDLSKLPTTVMVPNGFPTLLFYYKCCYAKICEFSNKCRITTIFTTILLKITRVCSDY